MINSTKENLGIEPRNLTDLRKADRTNFRLLDSHYTHTHTHFSEEVYRVKAETDILDQCAF